MPWRKANATPDVIISVEQGDFGELFDANGVNVTKNCFGANLSRGECYVYRTDRDGKKIIDATGRDVEKGVTTHPAPLRFERFKPGHPQYRSPSQREQEREHRRNANADAPKDA